VEYGLDASIPTNDSEASGAEAGPPAPDDDNDDAVARLSGSGGCVATSGTAGSTGVAKANGAPLAEAADAAPGADASGFFLAKETLLWIFVLFLVLCLQFFSLYPL
jgi:hypothetical protein